MATEQEPDVLQYTNYRVYLKDYYDYRKKHSVAFSLRFFAEKSGLSSHAHLKLTMDGKRNITKETATKLIIGLGLQGRRAEYFENLIFFNQAKTDREKQIYYDKLVRISPTSKLRKLDESQFRIFKEWYHSVIREMVTLKDFNGAPEWISRHTVDRIPVQRVQESLKLLQELGFLTRTANGFKQVDPLLTTDDEVSDLLVKQYHQQMIAQAQNALMQQPAERRDISALTFSIRRKDFSVLKKHLQLMRKELLNFQAGPGDGEEIVQVNIQLFPLSQE
jgi:uncharacterized protein (TIGR02147 family)